MSEISQNTQDLLTDEDLPRNDSVKELEDDVFSYGGDYPRVYVHGTSRYDFPGKDIHNLGQQFENIATIAKTVKTKDSTKISPEKVEKPRRANNNNDERLFSPEERSFQQLDSDCVCEEVRKSPVNRTPPKKKKVKFAFHSAPSSYRSSPNYFERIPRNPDEEIERVIRNLRNLKYKCKRYEKFI